MVSLPTSLFNIRNLNFQLRNVSKNISQINVTFWYGPTFNGSMVFVHAISSSSQINKKPFARNIRVSWLHSWILEVLLEWFWPWDFEEKNHPPALMSEFHPPTREIESFFFWPDVLILRLRVFLLLSTLFSWICFILIEASVPYPNCSCSQCISSTGRVWRCIYMYIYIIYNFPFLGVKVGWKPWSFLKCKFADPVRECAFASGLLWWRCEFFTACRFLYVSVVMISLDDAKNQPFVLGELGGWAPS